MSDPGTSSNPWPLTRHKVVLLGGAGPIGSAIVTELTGRGARVAWAVGSDAVAAAPPRRLYRPSSSAPAWVSLATDAGDEASVERFIDAAVETLDAIDALVTIQGAAPMAAFPELSSEVWQGYLDTNVRGPFLAARRVVEELLGTGGGGAIVTVTRCPPPSGNVLESVASAALDSFTRSLAREWGRRKILANAVEMPSEAPDPPAVVRCVGFLLSSGSTYINGERIRLPRP